MNFRKFLVLYWTVKIKGYGFKNLTKIMADLLFRVSSSVTTC